ncbi:dockerin type I domain-containing protein [Ruminococcus sp.]|uniref:dockerin type I domain-containing protein n=1 Tax=Ruminococcus sp. TaxID=41978 RepID=UPI00388F5A0C
MVKRILSIILAIAMLGSTAVIVASAEEAPFKTYNYVALGDSIAAGYGLTAPGTAADPALILSRDLIADPVQDAYAHVFGERLAEIGSEYGYTTTATNLSTTAYRAEDVTKTITTQGYKGAVATYILDTFVGSGTSDALLPYHDIFNEYLPDADMISIQLGGNDIVMGVINPMLESDNPILKETAIAIALLLFGKTPAEAVGAGAKLIARDKDIITLDHIAEATEYFAGVKDNAKQYVLTSADHVEGVVDAVQEINPDADIALIGMYNPYGNSLMYDGQVRDICTVLQNMFVKAVDEAVDINITVGDIQIIPSSDAEKDFEDLKSISYEIHDIAVDDDYFDEMRKEKIKALAAIAAEELAYPIQYLTAGKNVDPQIKLLNEKLQAIAERQGVTYVDVYDISNECNTDPHPTAEGHKEIADRLEAAMIKKIEGKMNPAAPIRGDVNGDGVVDINDVTILHRYLANMDVDYIDLDLADFNEDGNVDLIDATLLQRVLANMVG